MPHEPHAKNEQSALHRANFMTDLTPEQCRAIFERATIYERITVEWHDDRRFSLQRRAPAALGLTIPLNFDGTLTEVVGGTRVAGQITPETMQRIERALWLNRRGWLVAAALGPIVMLIGVLLGETPPDWPVLVGVYVAAMAFLAFVTHQKIAFLPMAMVSWLDDRLHPPPDLVPDLPHGEGPREVEV